MVCARHESNCMLPLLHQMVFAQCQHAPGFHWSTYAVVQMRRSNGITCEPRLRDVLINPRGDIACAKKRLRKAMSGVTAPGHSSRSDMLKVARSMKMSVDHDLSFFVPERTLVPWDPAAAPLTVDTWKHFEASEYGSCKSASKAYAVGHGLKSGP